MKFRVTETDRADLGASLEGDEAAYARLVTRYEALVFAQMWRFTRDRSVLDELVQDVFVEAYLSLGRFRGDAPFLHWLRRIATRVGYRHWKQEGRARQRQAALAQWAAQAASTARTTPTASEASEQLYRLLEHLAPKDRLVLTLYYLDECSANEIAERTGWNSTLVRVRIHRARKRLRRLMTEAGFGRTGHE